MNNDFLAGILGGRRSETPLNKQGNVSNSEPGNFMALLRNQLTEESAVDMSGEAETTAQSSSFGGLNSYNPLWSVNTGSSDSTYSDLLKSKSTESGFGNSYLQAKQDAKLEAAKSEKKASQADDLKAQHADARKSAQRDEARRVEEDRAEKAAAASNKTAESKEITKSSENDKIENSELENLLNAFSPEDKAALIEILNRLSPEDLEALAESPEEFNQKLVEMLMEMPDSAAKDEMLAIAESPEFLQLMQALSDQCSNAKLQMTNSSESQSNTHKTDDSEQVTDATQSDLSASLQAMSQAAEASQADSTTSNSDQEKQGEAEAEEGMKDHKTATRNTAEKNVETQQESASTGPKTGEESLREEFKRLNQSANEVNNENQQPENDNEPVITNKSTTQNLTAQPATPEQAKASIEDAARKFFALFSEKASGSTKSAEAATYSPEAIKRQSNMGNNSAGNGSNGFSSHTGTSASSMNTSRPTTPVPAANQIFSQMLEKAEYLKTQNGSKILNMEIDPGELGKIEMELTSKDGTVSARISAESTLAKARLDELAPQIKEQLLNQGINLTEITVDISSKNPDERNREQMSGGNNKSNRILATDNNAAETIIRKNILPNLRRAALNIKAVDLTV